MRYLLLLLVLFFSGCSSSVVYLEETLVVNSSYLGPVTSDNEQTYNYQCAAQCSDGIRRYVWINSKKEFNLGDSLSIHSIESLD